MIEIAGRIHIKKNPGVIAGQTIDHRVMAREERSRSRIASQLE